MFVVPMTRRSSAYVHPFNRLVEDRLERAYAAACAGCGPRSPTLDVIENDASFVAVLDMPGVAKEDVKVTVTGRRVTVQAEPPKSDSAENAVNLIHRERAALTYARSFTLPGDVEQAESQARLEQGVLTLTLPKRVARNEAHITVN
jgi:HSP20 family protein